MAERRVSAVRVPFKARDHFEMGAKRSLRRRCCLELIPHRLLVVLAEKARSGSRSRNADPTPMTRLQAPGPRVAKHTPGKPVIRPTAPAINAAADSWPASR